MKRHLITALVLAAFAATPAMRTYAADDDHKKHEHKDDEGKKGRGD
jgi:hypothetical protein